VRTFAGKVAVVTGAGSGIGRALAFALARQGARLAISDVDLRGLAETEAQVRALGARCRADGVDVADRELVLTYAADVSTEFRSVHLVINNAGVSHGGDVQGMSFADIERVLNVDFWGVVHGTKAFLPHLIASGDGTLVNISSIFGLVPIPGQSAYAAAKFAVRGFTESLRMEMLIADAPVRVTCVHPGGVKTAIARNGTVNAGDDPAGNAELFENRLARTSADKAAGLILRGAALGRPRVFVGWDARALHMLESMSNRGWQRAVASVFRRQM
jgi:NADP-dependent 3-hydroxy acid dehydrogenase YdfG